MTTLPNMRGGFSLVAVLVLAAVGLLIGAGSLLMFNFQCRMRIDRQHELEKVYAVRSVLNHIRTLAVDVPSAGLPFIYHTGSDRDLNLLVKPVDPIFAILGRDEGRQVTHDGRRAVTYWSEFGFTQTEEQFTQTEEQYRENHVFNYEFGMEGMVGSPTNGIAIKRRSDGVDFKYGLAFNMIRTNSVKWWVNVAMPGTGGWLQEAYGRRYCFWPQTYANGTNTFDDVRLCIVRNVTNEWNPVGRKHGWPLSREGERALVFQMKQALVNGTTNNTISVYEYEYKGGKITKPEEPLVAMENTSTLTNMGIQLAGDKVTMFYIDTRLSGSDATLSDALSRGYTFSPTVQMTAETYRYFADGIYTNAVDNRVYAPELRAVFEVEAHEDDRSGSVSENWLTDFRVTPAYQYDVFIEHPALVTNLATVAQRIGKNDLRKRVDTRAVLTYDTHGTDHKGFRRDEREHARGGGR